MAQILPRYLAGLRGSCACAMLAVGALLSASATQAQVAHDHLPPVRTGVTLPVAATPMPFDSTLSRYKPMTDQKLGSWREANDTVTRIGGWRSYLKEAQTPDDKTTTPAARPATPATPATSAVPAVPTVANPHTGHGAKP